MELLGGSKVNVNPYSNLCAKMLEKQFIPSVYYERGTQIKYTSISILLNAFTRVICPESMVYPYKPLQLHTRLNFKIHGSVENIRENVCVNHHKHKYLSNFVIICASDK